MDSERRGETIAQSGFTSQYGGIHTGGLGKLGGDAEDDDR